MGILANGLTFKPTLGGRKDAKPPTKTAVVGWSKHAARRNNKFLYSVVISAMTGNGVTFTLTVGRELPTATQFHSWIKSLTQQFRDWGCLRYHWVIEWQERGAPHLHGVVYFPASSWCIPTSDATPLVIAIPLAWLRISAASGSMSFGQHAVPIKDKLGWLKYLAKHASRGVNNYQRSPDNIPEQWKTGTGKVWGYGGNWERMEEVPIPLTGRPAYRFRRCLVKYLNSKEQGGYWRRYLNRDKMTSRNIGVSAFIPLQVSTALVLWARGR